MHRTKLGNFTQLKKRRGREGREGLLAGGRENPTITELLGGRITRRTWKKKERKTRGCI